MIKSVLLQMDPLDEAQIFGLDRKGYRFRSKVAEAVRVVTSQWKKGEREFKVLNATSLYNGCRSTYLGLVAHRMEVLENLLKYQYDVLCVSEDMRSFVCRLPFNQEMVEKAKLKVAEKTRKTTCDRYPRVKLKEGYDFQVEYPLRIEQGGSGADMTYSFGGKASMLEGSTEKETFDGTELKLVFPNGVVPFPETGLLGGFGVGVGAEVEQPTEIVSTEFDDETEEQIVDRLKNGRSCRNLAAWELVGGPRLKMVARKTFGTGRRKKTIRVQLEAPEDNMLVSRIIDIVKVAEEATAEDLAKELVGEFQQLVADAMDSIRAEIRRDWDSGKRFRIVKPNSLPSQLRRTWLGMGVKDVGGVEEAEKADYAIECWVGGDGEDGGTGQAHVPLLRFWLVPPKDHGNPAN